MCARCDILEAEVRELKALLGVTEDDAIGEAVWRAYRLSKTELRLALLLYAHRGRVVNRWAMASLLDRAAYDSDALKVHIYHLRLKLPASSVETIAGQGYRLTPTGLAALDAAVRPPTAKAA